MDSIPVHLSIKTSSGKLIKRFSHPDIHHMDRMLLWVWRELFVSMLAAGGRQARKKISEMLVDIEDSLGWESLTKIIHGGKKGDLPRMGLTTTTDSFQSIMMMMMKTMITFGAQRAQTMNQRKTISETPATKKTAVDVPVSFMLVIGLPKSTINAFMFANS